MTRTIGAAIGLILVVLFFVSLGVERSRQASSSASSVVARR
ncbi:MAG TPA: hypothetical protein VNR64_01970 [Vicinamibacterales bacterium]|nr:hypothetical protein [Vicinamibacterales bacterium]